MPSRREGLLSLLIASPMAMLGCSSEEPNVETEGSSTGPTGSDTSSTGPVDPGTSTGSTSTGDTGSSSGSTSLDGTTSTGPGPDDTTSSTSTGESSSSSSDDGEEESTTTGGQSGNTCQRVGDVFDKCFGGGYYGYSYYEYACTSNINYFIGQGDLACAQAYNDFYSCIADLECAELAMGAYQACDAENDVVNATCDWGWDSDSFGSFSESGVGFIVPETDGWTSGGFGGTDTDFGGWTDSGGGFGST